MPWQVEVTHCFVGVSAACGALYPWCAAIASDPERMTELVRWANVITVKGNVIVQSAAGRGRHWLYSEPERMGKRIMCGYGRKGPARELPRELPQRFRDPVFEVGSVDTPIGVDFLSDEMCV